MLRCRAIEHSEDEKSLFRIDDARGPAPVENVAKVARLADILLSENRLPGRFRAAGPGLLALELPAVERTFFHNGIVFAALDAYNDPVRNPTLTLSAEDPGA